jgi:hypothetical protein
MRRKSKKRRVKGEKGEIVKRVNGREGQRKRGAKRRKGLIKEKGLLN